jgi:hypothetical protein
MFVPPFFDAYLRPKLKLTHKPVRKIRPSKCYGISATNPGFTSESGGELRQHLVFGLKVEYALSSEVITRFLGRF